MACNKLHLLSRIKMGVPERSFTLKFLLQILATNFLACSITVLYNLQTSRVNNILEMIEKSRQTLELVHFF